MMHTRYGCKGRSLVWLAVLLVLAVGRVSAEEFRFRFSAGDKYRILSQVSEDIYVNRRFVDNKEIVNRIAFEVAEVRADGAGRLKGSFQTGTRSAISGYEVSQEYSSEYWHLPDGQYEIGPEYFMPVVRFVPTFPQRSLRPGDTWNAPAEERHDFRRDFGIPEPYVIPLDVRYRYDGPTDYQGKPVQQFRASYTIFYQPGRPSAYTTAYPVQISGYSDQIHYWDADRGGLHAYEERFRFIFELSNGIIIEYRGVAMAEVVEAELMDRASVAEQLRRGVEDLPDISIQSDDRGVTISLENIQFAPDSARLLPAELAKLRRIAELLRQYPERRLLVSGHTALAGTAEGRAELSQQRARAVAEALIALGVQGADDITVIGYGAERPLADNQTEAGRSRNRRVEITILEN